MGAMPQPRQYTLVEIMAAFNQTFEDHDTIPAGMLAFPQSWYAREFLGELVNAEADEKLYDRVHEDPEGLVRELSVRLNA
jgi:hypothetical protein